jgi:hypothetical protein
VFGGFYDPVSGTFSNMDKDVATRALAIMARAEEIFAEGKLGHRQAANKAMGEAKAAADDNDDPAGLF